MNGKKFNNSTSVGFKKKDLEENNLEENKVAKRPLSAAHRKLEDKEKDVKKEEEKKEANPEIKEKEENKEIKEEKLDEKKLEEKNENKEEKKEANEIKNKIHENKNKEKEENKTKVANKLDNKDNKVGNPKEKAEEKKKKESEEAKVKEVEEKLLKLGLLGEHTIMLQKIDNNLNDILRDISPKEDAGKYANNDIYKVILECEGPNCEKKRLSDLGKFTKASLSKLTTIEPSIENLYDKISLYQKIISDVENEQRGIWRAIKYTNLIYDKLQKNQNDEMFKQLLNVYKAQLESLQELSETIKKRYKNIVSSFSNDVAKCNKYSDLNQYIKNYNLQLKAISEWIQPLKVKIAAKGNVRQLFGKQRGDDYLSLDNNLYLPYQNVGKTRKYIRIPIKNNKLSLEEMDIAYYDRKWKTACGNGGDVVQSILNKGEVQLYNRRKPFNLSSLKDREIQIVK